MAQLQADTARRPWIPIQTSQGWILYLRRRSFARSQAKSHESATVIGSAPPVVANPADITSYYRAMYDERKGVRVRWGGCARVVGGVVRVERVSLVCQKRSVH